MEMLGFHRPRLRKFPVPVLIGSAALIAALLAAPAAVRANLAVSPAKVRLTLDGGRPSGTFTITNTSDLPARYRAKAIHFEFSEGGALQVVAPNEHSLTTWIRFNPTEFDLPAKSKQIVRYSLVTPREMHDGEYWGAIEFEPLASMDSKLADKEGRTMNLKVFVSTLVPIFATRGTPRLGIKAADAAIVRERELPVLKVRLENRGSGRLDVGGRFELWSSSLGKVCEGTLPSATLLLCGGTRVVATPLPAELLPGSYEVRVRLETPQLEKAVEAVLPVAF